MEPSSYIIATLGSHSALQILHGAKQEGFKTLVITTPNQTSLYKRYGFIDDIEEIETFADFPKIEAKLKDKKIIIIPHGSFVAYLGTKKNQDMQLNYFGNKKILEWEEDRDKQRIWLDQAGILLPAVYDSPDTAEYPVIVKSFGAAGGRGYFLAKNKQDFEKKLPTLGSNKYMIQQYIVGVPLYIHYFYSPLSKKIEILSMDRRYETNVDGIGRIPAADQEGLDISPSYVVVGNSPLVIRESMLEECYRMGEDTVYKSQELIDKRGLFGPFCLETIITPDQKIYCIEISGRIVAGTNLFTQGSSYSSLTYVEPMSTGRRIAREIKDALKTDRLKEILD